MLIRRSKGSCTFQRIETQIGPIDDSFEISSNKIIKSYCLLEDCIEDLYQKIVDRSLLVFKSVPTKDFPLDFLIRPATMGIAVQLIKKEHLLFL